MGVCVPSLQSCLTLCDPMDCSLPGSSINGILQARILEWVALPTIFSTQESNLCLLSLLHCRLTLCLRTTREALVELYEVVKIRRGRKLFKEQQLLDPLPTSGTCSAPVLQAGRRLEAYRLQRVNPRAFWHH